MIVGARDDFGATAGTQVTIRGGLLLGATLAAPTNDAVAVIYDGTSAAGRRVATIATKAGDSRPLDAGGGAPCSFAKGIFIVVTGVGAQLSISYSGVRP